MTARRALDVAALVVAAPFIVLALFACDLWMNLALRLGGEAAFYRAVTATGRLYLAVFRKVFRMRFTVEGEVPDAVGRGPFVLVASHQPPVDLLLTSCIFKENSPAFVARAGLDRWCPTVSVFLRGTGSLVLKRGDREGNVAALRAFGARTEARRRGAIIFPEGRKRWGDESVQAFHRPGVRAVLEGAPTAVVIPIVYEGIAPFLGSGGLLPAFGLDVRARILAPIARAPGDVEDVIDAAERAVREASSARPSRSLARGTARATPCAAPAAGGGPAWT